MAWRFWHTTRRAFGDCLRLAWQNFKIVRRMQTDVVKFYFQKVDGSIREAWGTLREDIVSPVKVYFDTERQEWRCFKRLNLVG